MLHLGDHLRDFYIGVTMDDLDRPEPGKYPLCRAQYIGAAKAGQKLTLQCEPWTKGRYVWIQMQATSEFLSLCEVEVYGAGQLYQYYVEILEPC